MAVPSGEIVARPMVARACGCLCEFQHYAVDKYRAQRLAKFQKTRCPDDNSHRQTPCAAALGTDATAVVAALRREALGSPRNLYGSTSAGTPSGVHR